MCYATKCRNCGKTTWAGCGNHVANVKRQVPASQWCNGHAKDEKSSIATDKPAGFFARLFNR